MRRHRRQLGFARRRGTLMPAIVVAIVVVCMCAALVFDRLWLDAARIELRTAAEAAALAATGRLVNDDRLRTDSNTDSHLDGARAAAVSVAAENRVAGARVHLDPTPGRDIRFGTVTDDPYTGEAVFLETDFAPTTVVVTAQAVRSRGNGVALFFRGLTGVGTGNVIARAGVTIDNRILGVGPFPGVPVPAIPLGILESDPADEREDTWQRQITQREGTDRYGFDEATQRVTDGPDGIPEITLAATSENPTDAADADSIMASPNCCVVDLGSGLQLHNVRRQLADGWASADLAYFGGQLLPSEDPVTVDGSAELLADLEDDLLPIIGRRRICVLYQEDGSNDDNGTSRIRVTRLVSGRILLVERESERIRIIFQPAVITTPTAVLAVQREDVAPNPYIYKLHLTH